MLEVADHRPVTRAAGCCCSAQREKYYVFTQ